MHERAKFHRGLVIADVIFKALCMPLSFSKAAVHINLLVECVGGQKKKKCQCSTALGFCTSNDYKQLVYM